MSSRRRAPPRRACARPSRPRSLRRWLRWPRHRGPGAWGSVRRRRRRGGGRGRGGRRGRHCCGRHGLWRKGRQRRQVRQRLLRLLRLLLRPRLLRPRRLLPRSLQQQPRDEELAGGVGVAPPLRHRVEALDVLRGRARVLHALAGAHVEPRLGAAAQQRGRASLDRARRLLGVRLLRVVHVEGVVRQERVDGVAAGGPWALPLRLAHALRVGGEALALRAVQRV
mmetsp:Transcript_2170/g.7578  ORF Transcript_2170/g.7578 Transcript_2170/m.7578 type:complete len:224 (-) Transcript_2170:122-793(-)